MRKIIHIDMDCFFAAIEMREQPTLRGKPIAVGGSPNGRGVVATCSYEARQFGVHSAMPMGVALRKCPHLMVLPVNMPLYKQVSKDIQALFTEYTDIIQPLSLDEAFLDVTNSPHHQGSATLIAQAIRERIASTQNLTASAGIAPNKFLAKVASDWQKPNGQYVIRPQDIADFMLQLPVTRIPGVGKVTATKMEARGINTCADLQTMSRDQLSQAFGSFGERLYELSRGIDERPVKTSGIRKSLSVEDTFAEDLPSLEACLLQVAPLFESLKKRLAIAKQRQRLTPKTLFIKMRFHDFVTTTVQTPATDMESIIKRAYFPLIAEGWDRGQRPVRLLGLGVHFGDPHQPEQLRFNFENQRKPS